MTTERVDHLWYVSYGSNLSRARFDCYLRGGTPPGGRRRNPGARDHTPPVRDVGVRLPGTTFFAIESPQWGGGVAFYDHQSPGPTLARAYLITPQQLADVAAQEMYREPGDDALAEVAVGPLLDGRHAFGDGHYETLVAVGELDGVPMLTFTTPHGVDDVEHVAPGPAYRATMASGLRESHHLDDDQIATYLDDLVLRSAGADRSRRPR